MITSVANGLQRVVRGQPKVATAKAIELNFRPLIPLILAGSGLIYNQGRENNKKDGDPTTWLKVLAESGAAYTVLANTSGVYPLAGIALAAYRAGKEPNALEQVKACVNTVVTMSMGYLGVKVFKTMSNADVALDNEMLLKALNPGEHPTGDRQIVQSWLQKLTGHSDPKLKTLGGILSDLGNTLEENGRNLDLLKSEGKTDAVLEASQRITERLSTLKTQVAETFGQLEKPALEQLENESSRKIIKNLMSSVNYSQSAFIKGIRAMNPIFGYILSGLMLGTPIAFGINSWLDRRYPQLKEKKLNKSILPSEHRILNGNNPQQTQDKAFKRLGIDVNAPGPTPVKVGKSQQTAVFWPGMNNNQPMR